MVCISNFENQIHKQSLTDCVDVLEIAESDFDSKFVPNEIYQIVQEPIVLGEIGQQEMTNVYDNKMVAAKAPGRIYYDSLRASAPYGKCPLCSIRDADTLDHYLPKALYPVYAVTPMNLFPACTPCNKGKLISFPKSNEDQTLHPYYDNVNNVTWISARLHRTSPISFEYFVMPPANWTEVLKKRAISHFEAFELNDLFSSHANEELRGTKKQMTNLYNNNPNLLVDYLRESYKSRLDLGLNSWQAVMYNTLLNDDWFCSGGFLT